MNNIAIIGGDEREKIVAKLLANKGYNIHVLSNKKFYESKNISYCNDIEKIIPKKDVILAPMSNTDQKGFLKHTFINKNIKLDKNFFKMISRDTIFIIGIAKKVVKNNLKNQAIKFTEMALEDDIAILNAIPTAEGAIKKVIEETPITIYGSKFMIFGLGKVGYSLAWRLKALGADVYAATRSKKAFASGKDIGIKMIDYHEIHPKIKKIDIFFNTVPAAIISKEYISYMKSSAFIYDLASSPGGTDFNAAAMRNIEAKLLPGLPGKTAPEFAARVIADNIEKLISRADIEGVN